jgi:hypothetical protein
MQALWPEKPANQANIKVKRSFTRETPQKTMSQGFFKVVIANTSHILIIICLQEINVSTFYENFQDHEDALFT